MPTTESKLFRIKDGVVTAEPTTYARAIETVRRDRLRGLDIRTDFSDNDPKAPVVDLALLEAIPFIEVFGLSSIGLKRILNFDAVYGLSSLKELGLQMVKKIDLSRFPKLEMLFLTDAPGVTNLEALTQLRYARITKLRTDDLSFLSRMPHMSELWIIQAPSQHLHGLDRSPSLATLELSHCPKLRAVDALPKSLTKLKVMRCPHLRDLSFMAHHPSLEFLYVDVMETLGFISSLPKLSYVGFENVLDGNLEPLVKSASLTRAGFYPAKRKHYSHNESQINDLLKAKQPS